MPDNFKRVIIDVCSSDDEIQASMKKRAPLRPSIFDASDDVRVYEYTDQSFSKVKEFDEAVTVLVYGRN